MSIRAKAFVPGLVPSTTVTRTYNILSPELFEFSSNLPILVLTTFGTGPNESTPIKASATDKLDLNTYKDVHTEKLTKLIEAKVVGQELVSPSWERFTRT